MPTNVMWFRRDLRLRDNPALLAAAGQQGLGGPAAAVVPLFVLDSALWGPSGPGRQAHLVASLEALGGRIGGSGVLLRRGDPAAEVLAVARAAQAEEVHVAADFGPYGQARDAAVERALAEHGIALVRTGSPYAVAPGRVFTKSGTPMQVFTPFFRAWVAHGWRDAAPSPRSVDWAYPLKSQAPPKAPDAPSGPAGEEAALRRWRSFRDGALQDYSSARDRPDLDGTSALSVPLKWGELHPRTVLADLADLTADADPMGSDGPSVFRREIAWREFQADVLFHRPHVAREYLRPEFARMRYDAPGTALTAWQRGRTGYPVVDAGMRQLLETGWMHNRVRMIVASFLVKDLHVEWQHGARHFMHHLRDGDLASNSMNWQWVAGCGTDAAPYFRVFNPISQGQKFDPDGAYVRRWIPELAHLSGAAAHTPWDSPNGYSKDYPRRIVDHADERAEALRRLAEIAKK
ncbi:MAG: cryptochrome/photolyase family protein [Sporichthyaceae bacterium]